jgi:hypothetical protein
MPKAWPGGWWSGAPRCGVFGSQGQLMTTKLGRDSSLPLSSVSPLSLSLVGDG